MKKLLLILLILNWSNYLVAQSLSINETLEYLNKILLTHKNGSSYQSINIKEDGKLRFKHYNSNYLLEFNVVESTIDHLTVNTGNRGETYVQISFKGYAIQYIDIKGNTKKIKHGIIYL